MILHHLPYIKENVGEITAETWCSRQFPKCIAKNCSLRIAFPQCIPKTSPKCVMALRSGIVFPKCVLSHHQYYKATNRWVTNNI